MTPHLKYLSYVLRHKWHVLYAGLYLGVPIWQLLVHDFSKFSRAEWSAYVDRFFSGRGSQWEKDQDTEAFHRAWSHHWQNNQHHWEWWCHHFLDPVRREIDPIEMPEKYVREMVSDWYGAGMAQGKSDIAGWYAQYGQRMRLHSNTRALVTHVIQEGKDKGLFV